MFIPVFIAILLGLLSPLNQSAYKAKRIVYVKMDAAAPQPTTFDTDSIPPNDDDGPGSTGDTGQLPPPKP